ncbi:FKBP-type peptidyl-prolyl cis-trans isomerase 2 [Cytobacillus horneckiae]
MYFPTVLNRKNTIRHIVKDWNHAYCGYKLNFSSNITPIEFKKIQFCNINTIDCIQCKKFLSSNDID